jgi:DNA (cytosine-5)-methyltransferase 1
LVHPTEHHGITLRQAARFQSFPEWFNFSGGIMAGGVQVGNAVPVDLAKALLEPLKEAVIALRTADKRKAAA